MATKSSLMNKMCSQPERKIPKGMTVTGMTPKQFKDFVTHPSPKNIFGKKV